MRGLVTAALVLIALIGALGLVWAQLDPPPCPYEMRAYVDSTTDSTRQFNLSTIRATYVCPHCGYSSYHGEGEDCPNPYGVTGHSTAMNLVAVARKTRVLAATLQSMAAGARDYEYTNTAGSIIGRAMLGKVFHPEDGTNADRSTLHLQTCDVAGADPADTIGAASRLRLFIMPPGVTRPCATQIDLDNISSEGGGDLFDADDDAATIKDTYIEIGLNPYRVDNGDEWLVRYTRTEDAGGNLTSVQVQVASLLYGFDLDITDTNPTAAGNNCYITNSGGLVVTLHHNNVSFDITDGTSETWLFHFTVQSNAYIMPSHCFDDMGGVGFPSVISDADDLTDWAWSDLFPVLTDAKQCWLTPTGGVITDTSAIVHAGAGTPTPYVIPANMVGVGIAAAQYSNVGDDVGLPHDGSGDWRFYKNWEWQYDYQETVTNEEVAQAQDLDAPPAAPSDGNFRATSGGTDTHQQWVQHLGECHYFSSRVELPPPSEPWVHSDGTATPGWPNADYPRIVVGEPDGSGNIAGEYGPGANTATRPFYLYNRFDDGTNPRRCEFCGYITQAAICPFHADRNNTSALTTYYRASAALCRKLAVSGEVESTGGTAPTRHVLPEAAFKYHEYNRYVYPIEVSSATAGQLAVHFDIPKYQPPSVPAAAGANYQNDLSGDEGYRGGLIMCADQRNYPSGSSGLSGGWDVFYRCPDCGGLTPDPASHVCSSGHQLCPFCGAEYPRNYDGDFSQAGNQCGFCRGTGTLGVITGNDTVQEHDLWCEEYDVGDLQVSVLRKAAMRATVPAVQIGRVQPGVTTTRPDTNVQNIAGGYRAFPSDTSPRIALPVLNLGNVTSPIRIANVNDPAAASAELSLPHYSRIEVPAYDYSYTRIAQSTPITRLTLQSYNPALLADAEWDITSALPFSTGGTELFGRLQAGYSGYPLPLGQPAGTYLGQTLYFLDTDGDGALDFEIGGPGGAATDTFSTQFDPLADHPLEPVYDTVVGDVRVFGSRLPQNDYYSADSSPVPIIAPGDEVQVIWVGNRPSAAGAGSVPVTCAPGDDISDIPSSSAAVNLLYATASYAGAVADDPLYRAYGWPVSGTELVDAYNLSNDSAAGTVSSSPWALGDDADRWAFWHRRLQHPGGTESTLRYDTSTGAAWAWSGSGTGEWIYASGLPKENLRSFIDGDDEHWLFWHTGSEGKQYLMYRWDYTLGSTDSNEAPVPVTNRASREWRADTFPAIDPRDTSTNVGIKKPTQGPFTYTKDPSVFPDPSGNVNLFFSGYARSEREADICWTRFDPDGMDGADTTIPNYGKLAFARPQASGGPSVYTSSDSWLRMPEEFSANGLRQVFTSRGLDWLCHDDGAGDDFATSPWGPVGGVSFDPTDGNYLWGNSYLDPVFCLALIYDDPDDGLRPQTELFWLTWENGTYFRSRGVYRVLPKLYPLAGASLSEPPGVADGSGYLLQDPSAPNRRVVMEISPATGTVTFSSPLFNIDNPADPLAVFYESMSLGGSVNLVDVALFGAYHPYVYRVTRSGADDDCPSAFYNADLDPSRLTIFWRRRYPVSSRPHFGRTGFMHKTYTTSVRVARPSIASVGSVVNAYDTATSIPYTADADALAGGIITVSEGYIGYTLQVTYDSADGSNGVVEYHEVPGWSVETPVPIRTGGAEGRLVVKPEAYSVAGANTVRYWLFWTSLGRVYDMRLLDASSTRVDGEPIILQSADVYSAVVSPDAGPVIRERPMSSVSFDPT